nr:MAG TPA: hypothetical protein [Caudoviricetes sp.]
MSDVKHSGIFYHRVLKDELHKRKTLLLKAAQMRCERR